MNRAKNILVSLRIANSFISTQLRNTTRTPCSQVTQFSQLSSPFPVQHHCSHPFNTHQKLFFSSTPNSVVELVVANDWSTELETELDISKLGWSHESVIYILKNLDKYPQKAFHFFKWAREKDGFRPSSSIYCLVLRILLLEDMENFWVTLTSMKEQGFYLDGETYMTMVSELRKQKMEKEAAVLTHYFKRMLEENVIEGKAKEVVSVVSKLGSTDQVGEKLDEVIGELTDDFVIRVLRGLRNYPFKALSFFDWVDQFSGYEHSTVTYNALARVLGQGQSAVEFWSVIERMKSRGFDLDLDSYVKILRNLLKNKMAEEAVRLYEFMMDGPYKPSSVQDCALLLRRLSASNDPDTSLAFRVARKYESAGFSLSKVAYDGIHRCLTAAGKFDEAEKIVEIMKNSGEEPDNITYSQLVFGLCKARRFGEAREVLENMKAVGCDPDIKTWTILIQGHCDAGQVDEAVVHFAEMLQTDCEVDADLLEVLVKGFVGEHKVIGAYNLLVEMVKNSRLKPWQATYKSLIDELLKISRLEEATELLRLMKKQDYPPYPDPFVSHISKFGTVEDAFALLKALTVKEGPTPTAYLHVFKSFFKEGRHLEAKDLLFKCPHHIRKHRDICQLFGSAESTSESNPAT